VMKTDCVELTIYLDRTKFKRGAIWPIFNHPITQSPNGPIGRWLKFPTLIL
jgi:hypothetical protein